MGGYNRKWQCNGSVDNWEKNTEATVCSTGASGAGGDGAILVAVGDGINPWRTAVVRGISLGIYVGND